MKKPLIAAIAVLAAGCAELPRESAGREVKIAFDITEGNPVVLASKLETIELTRKQVIAAGMTPRFILAFRGGAAQFTQDGIAHVKEDQRADALQVRRRLGEMSSGAGVESMEQCGVTLARFKLSDKTLLKPIKSVPNGWITLANYQERGYSYIAP